MIFPHQETQTDLEVILEFLEEYYKQSSGENGKTMAWIIIQTIFPFTWAHVLSLSVEKVPWLADEEPCQQAWMCYEPPVSTETKSKSWEMLATTWPLSITDFIKRTWDLLPSLCRQSAPRHLSAKTKQQRCASVGQCQAVHRHDK